MNTTSLLNCFILVSTVAFGAFQIGCSGLNPVTPRNKYIIPVQENGPNPDAPADHASYWDGDHLSGSPMIKIVRREQKAYFYKGGQLAGVAAISTGDAGHTTPAGRFKVSQKSPNHRSSIYGDYVDDAGNVVKKDVDNRKDPKPPGTKYLGAPMNFFLRFNYGIGMHEGYLPGYPASHGCVRMPRQMAKHFYENAKIGTPVIVE